MPVPDTVKKVAHYPAMVARMILAIVALAWGTFAYLGASDPEPSWIGYTWATVLTALLASFAIGSWIHNRWTGAAAIFGGLAAASFFHHPAPQLAMALPLTAAGVLLLWQGDRPRKTRASDDLPPAPKPRADDDLDLV